MKPGAETRPPTTQEQAGLELALRLARMGWPVHRLKPGTKTPATDNGLKDATTNEDALRVMFEDDGNVGTPGTNQVLILDVDVVKAEHQPKLTEQQRRQVAQERLANLLQRFEECRDAPLTKTPSGGFHVYLSVPDKYVNAKPNTPEYITTGSFPAIAPRFERWGEVRGLGRAYVVVAGSTTRDGTYTTIRELLAPGDAPMASEALIRWLTARGKPQTATHHAPVTLEDDKRDVSNPDKHAQGILAGVQARLGSVQTGRNEACYGEALTLGRWIGGYQAAGLPQLSIEDGRQALLEAMHTNGDYADDPRKAEATITNGLRNGMSSAYQVTHKQQTQRDYADSHASTRSASNQTHELNPLVTTAPGLLEHPQDDLGYADAIAQHHGPALRWHVALGALTYNEHEKRHNTGEAATARAHALAVATQRSIMATAQAIDDDKARKGWERYARSLRSRNKREAALALMLETDALVTDNELDGHALEINTPDGVLNLQTLELDSHDPRRVFTGVTTGRYRPDVTHAAVDAVLELLHEDGRAEYVQRALGQALTGRTNRDMFIFEGPKATGKTTLGEGLMAALGTDYAATVDPSTLLEAGRSRNPGGPRSDLVALRTARFALTSEPSTRTRLDGQTVKRMTGSDSITARAVHGRAPITFRPGFTILMLANTVPGADWSDDALLSRLKLVPFRARPAKVNPAVRAALVDDPQQAALDALFTWAAQGAHAWIANGFQMGDEPDAVKDATRTYRAENDPFALWSEDRLRFEPQTITNAKDLHDDYVQWAANNGVTEPARVEALGKWLKTQAENGTGLERKRSKGRSSWHGVRIVGPTG